MSLDQASKFIDSVREDKDLRLEAQRLGSDTEAIVEFAALQGFEITEDELAAAVREQGYSLDAEGDLDDDQLANVSGGAEATISCTNALNCW